jgi:DNA invertase Pin-like site-specific DNA recombinase
MLIGYARVSTKTQTLDLQIDALEKAGCEKIFSENISGAKAKRTAMEMCLNYLRPGDTLLVYSIDRLGRNKRECDRILNHLKDNKMIFASLTENLNTSRDSEEFMMNIRIAFAEEERRKGIAKTMAGLAAARARGRCGGRVYKYSKDKRKIIVELYHTRKYSLAEIAQMHNISIPTIYNWVNEFKDEE